MEFLRYKPCGLWLAEATTTLPDLSGLGNDTTALASGGMPLTSYTSSSLRVGNNNVVEFPSLVYRAGRERDSFTIVLSLFAQNLAGKIQALGNLNQYDGIYVDNGSLAFSTMYTNTGEAKCSYDIPYNQKLDVVAIHSPQKNTLYVNGVLVDETDITDIQRADTFASPDDSLYSGYSDSDNELLLNAVALYPRELTNDEVARLYLSINTRASGSPALPFDGREIVFSTTTRQPYLDVSWTQDSDWESAESVNVSTEDNSIYAQMANGVTLLGQWIDTIDLYEGDNPTPIESLYMLWEGKNETVEASVDTGETWVAVQQGVVLPNIPSGFDPTDKTLMIRVTLAAGEDESYVSSMTVRGFIGDTAESGGRQITYSQSSVALDNYTPAILHDNWGVRLNGGSLSIGVDQSGDPLEFQTLEIWFKMSSTNVDFNAITLGGTATKTVGSSQVGEWTAVQYTFPTPVADTITASGDIQIGKIVLYPTALTAEQSDTIFENYFGITSERIDSDVNVAMAEPADSTVIYAHDWSTVSS